MEGVPFSAVDTKDMRNLQILLQFLNPLSLQVLIWSSRSHGDCKRRVFLEGSLRAAAAYRACPNCQWLLHTVASPKSFEKARHCLLFADKSICTPFYVCCSCST